MRGRCGKPEGYSHQLFPIGYYLVSFDTLYTSMESTALAQPHPVTYNPDNLIDALIERLELKNDAALARLLEIAPPILSKIRHRRLPVGAALLIRMHEVSGLPVRELRNLMGDRRQKYRISLVQGKPK